MNQRTHARELLVTRSLRVESMSGPGPSPIIEDLDLTVLEGEIVGLVGESGAGKSVAGAAILGLLEHPLRQVGGEVLFDGQRIDKLDSAGMRKLRGSRIAMVFQDPLTALNPVLTIGRQLVETIRAHTPLGRKEATIRAAELLKDVGIPAAVERLKNYPHEFSGGMRQRVVVALALAGNPEMIIADEPTTALDVSIQAQVISLLARIAREKGTAILLITHDMGIIAQMAHRVAVMYAGRIVEIGPVAEILRSPRHPYTKGLIGSIPTIGAGLDSLPQIGGSMPRPGARPQGCSFHPRCPQVLARCREERPQLGMLTSAASVACWVETAT